jgi:hypothetical protein
MHGSPACCRRLRRLVARNVRTLFSTCHCRMLRWAVRDLSALVELFAKTNATARKSLQVIQESHRADRIPYVRSAEVRPLRRKGR